MASVTSLAAARKAIDAAKSTPPPLAGRVDPDATLALKIAEAIDEAVAAERKRVVEAVELARGKFSEGSQSFKALTSVLDQLS